MDAEKLVAWFEVRKGSLANEFVRAVMGGVEEIQEEILAVVKERDEALSILEQRLSKHDYDVADPPGTCNIMAMCQLVEGKRVAICLVTLETLQRRRKEVIAMYDPKIELLIQDREKKEKEVRGFLATHRPLFENKTTKGDVEFIRVVLGLCGIKEGSIEAASAV